MNGLAESNAPGSFDGIAGGYLNESGNTLFADGQESGSLSWITWKTAAVVQFGPINLIAFHDFDDGAIEGRGFRSANFYYGDGSIWTPFLTIATTDPDGDGYYGGGPSYPPDPNDPHNINRSFLEAYLTLNAPVSAQYFKAEFEQAGGTSWAGSRVCELDA